MQQRQSARVGGAYGVVTCLFAWGFITFLNDPLVASVKGIFRLSDVEAQLTAFAFFIAYGVMSLPGALLLSRMKSVSMVLLALGMMITGCPVMMAAVRHGLHRPGARLRISVLLRVRFAASSDHLRSELPAAAIH